MEGDVTEVAPCSSLAVDAILRLGTAGAIWGSCVGPHDARNKGLRGTAFPSYVGKTVGSYGFKCGLVAGVFTFTRCGIQRYRRREDWVNSLIAGGVAGAVVAAGTRNWNQVVEMAALVSAFCAVADYSKTF